MSVPVLRSILYVEDDATVREVAKVALEMLGRYTVRDCESGCAALMAARDFHPDLILLDLIMPEMDGIATLGLLRRFPHLHDTPVMFVTGCTDSADLQRYRTVGAIGVIPKPLEPMRLAFQLRSFWDHRALAVAH